MLSQLEERLAAAGASPVHVRKMRQALWALRGKEAKGAPAAARAPAGRPLAASPVVPPPARIDGSGVTPHSPVFPTGQGQPPTGVPVPLPVATAGRDPPSVRTAAVSANPATTPGTARANREVKAASAHAVAGGYAHAVPGADGSVAKDVSVRESSSTVLRRLSRRAILSAEFPDPRATSERRSECAPTSMRVVISPSSRPPFRMLDCSGNWPNCNAVQS